MIFSWGFEVSKIKVIPKSGQEVMNPFQDGSSVPEDGLEVPYNSYWYRKKSEGVLDIIILGKPDADSDTDSDTDSGSTGE